MIFSQSAINERKTRAAKALNDVLEDSEAVMVWAGSPITKPGGHDQTYPFLPHPDYFWLTGSRRPQGISVYSKREGWADFIEPVSRDEKIWEGGAQVISGKDLSELDNYLMSIKAQKTFQLGQVQAFKSEDLLKVQEALSAVRRVKDAEEVALVEKIAAMAAKGYEKVSSIIRPGMTERDIQIEYEAEVFRAGAEKMPYESIVGTGTNSAILHAIPTARVLKAGEHVLIDAGADLHDYCVDITRNFPVSGTMSERQKNIHKIVLSAQEKSIAMLRPGTQWKDVHLASARIIAEGLKALGVLKVSADEAIGTEAISVFFPHGVGHMVGLRVRDVGGPSNPNPKTYAGARLRVDMELKEGHLMTVEPGLYFIEALIQDDQTRLRFRDQINWNEVAKWSDFGGMRIEDDILVTSSNPRNLTAAVAKIS